MTRAGWGVLSFSTTPLPAASASLWRPTSPSRGEVKRMTSALVSARGFLAGASSRPFGLRLRVSEGARDAGDFRSPRSCVEKVERHRRSSHEVPVIPPASRARCLRLAPHEPRWTYRAPLSRGPCSIHRWRASSALRPSAWQRRMQAAKEGPCDARQARRARAAWAALAGCVTPAPRPPPPTPRQKNALETPLGWGGMAGM